LVESRTQTRSTQPQLKGFNFQSPISATSGRNWT
jgi:hypothetical protein